ncbi:hypothetical protein [Chitinophaga sp. GbtcB8]|nr:hypothetical protein [Chitinophaga sp. GbtcB8]
MKKICGANALLKHGRHPCLPTVITGYGTSYMNGAGYPELFLHI